MDNNIQPKEQKPKFLHAISSERYQNIINATLKDPKRAQNFIANISTVVTNNPALQTCVPSTILAAAFLAESLELPMSPQLGFCYLVPYKTAVKGPDGKKVWKMNPDGTHVTDSNGKWEPETVNKAQFQMGYKGWIQLAIRSGRYKKINVLPIKKGELIRYDPLFEEIEVNLIDDDFERENAETIGYYAMFELHEGYRKSLFWTKKKMISHADKYSAAFSAKGYEQYVSGKVPQKDEWKYSSFWYKDFDAMAMKTMLRQLIPKWGPTSVEVRNVYEKDMSIMEEDNKYTYPDIDPDNTIIDNLPQPQMQDDGEPMQQEDETPTFSEENDEEEINLDEI